MALALLLRRRNITDVCTICTSCAICTLAVAREFLGVEVLFLDIV